MKRLFNKNRLYIILTGIAIFTGCTENANINDYVKGSDLVTLLVVDAEITTDTTAHHVILTKSGNITNSGEIQVFSNAKVSITDGINTFILHENPEQPGTYLTDSDVYGIPGRTYTLNISNVDLYGDGGNETFKATSVMKKINPVDSMAIAFAKFGKYKTWFIDIWSKDIGSGLNYYLPKAWKNDTLLTDSIYKYRPTNNESFIGKDYGGLPAINLSERLTENILRNGDRVTMELDGITVDYFNFIEDFIEQSTPKNPLFSGPSANVPTNIYPQNEALGFFAVYSIQRKSLVYK